MNTYLATYTTNISGQKYYIELISAGAMEKMIGRKVETKLLRDALNVKTASLVAVYGRRRVGKTYLIRNTYQDRLIFELTGMYGASLKDQLVQFSRSLQKATGSALAIKPPNSWVEAFQALEQLLAAQSKRKKLVVFLDEFPWLDGRKSGFLQAFEHFWNSWASRQSYILIAICGSAASWMIRNIVNSKGGLHQRITQKIRLLPFTLAETESYIRNLGSNIDRYQILQIYMAMGGIPQYLNNIGRGDSAAAVIQRTCFSKDGLLTGEFNNLYGSLFELADNHIKAVRALAARPSGLTRQEVIDECGLSSGGRTTLMLEELEESGFIQPSIPYDKISKDAIYRLIDEYSLFYLKFMDKRGTKQEWARISESNTYRVWSGMAYEAVCLKHVDQIKQALGLAGKQTREGTWRYVPPKGSAEKGAQIDLLIDRDDHNINICEIKFFAGELTIDKSYAAELKRKLDVFREKTRPRKTLFLTLITTYGAKQNMYFNSLVHQSLDMEVLMM